MRDIYCTGSVMNLTSMIWVDFVLDISRFPHTTHYHVICFTGDYYQIRRDAKVLPLEELAREPVNQRRAIIVVNSKPPEP